MKKRNISKPFGIQRGLYQRLNIIFFLLCLSITSATSAMPQQYSNENDAYLTSSINDAKEKYFIDSLKKYLGIPYRRGGATEKGFDCSGFVRRVYTEYFGIDLPHGSKSQSLLTIMQQVSKGELITGDLIFFSTTGNKRINHVGIYLSDGLFIHASKHGVTISSLDDSYWKNRFTVAKRIANTDIWAGIDVGEGDEASLLAMYDNLNSSYNQLSILNMKYLFFDKNYLGYNSYNVFSLGREITWTNVGLGSIIPKFNVFRGYMPLNREINDLLYFFPINGQFRWSIPDKKSP